MKIFNTPGPVRPPEQRVASAGATRAPAAGEASAGALAQRVAPAPGRDPAEARSPRRDAAEAAMERESAPLAEVPAIVKALEVDAIQAELSRPLSPADIAALAAFLSAQGHASLSGAARVLDRMSAALEHVTERRATGRPRLKVRPAANDAGTGKAGGAR